MLGAEFEVISQSSSLRSYSSIREPDIFLEPAADRDLYLKDEICINCSRKFNIPGVSHSKKLYCFFCYRGVCMNCLSYENFHCESKHYEKMCPQCYHKLSIKSEKFHHELQLYRLERAELWKQIKVACQQREVFVKERQMAAEELENIKKTTDLTDTNKDLKLEKLRSENQVLVKKVEAANKVLAEENERKDELDEKYLRIKKDLEKEKKKMEEQSTVATAIKSEINVLEPRLSIMRKMKARENFVDEDVVEKIEQLRAEIQKLEEILDDKEKMNSDICGILNELDEQIEENEAKIRELEQRLSGIKNDDREEFSENELRRLGELKEQLKQLDDLVRMAQDRRRQSQVRIDVNLRPHVESSMYSLASGLETTGNRSTAAGPEEQKHCCDIL